MSGNNGSEGGLFSPGLGDTLRGVLFILSVALTVIIVLAELIRFVKRQVWRHRNLPPKVYPLQWPPEDRCVDYTDEEWEELEIWLQGDDDEDDS